MSPPCFGSCSNIQREDIYAKTPRSVADVLEGLVHIQDEFTRRQTRIEAMRGSVTDSVDFGKVD